MDVEVEARGDETPLVTLLLDRADLRALESGEAVPFDVTLRGEETLACELALKEGFKGSDRAVAHRLRIDAHALNGVSVGASVSPMFSGVPFLLTMKLAADVPERDGPVKLTEGLFFERVRLNLPTTPRRGFSQRLDWKDRGLILAIAILFLTGAYLLRDYQSSFWGLGIIGLVALYGAIRGMKS